MVAGMSGTDPRAVLAAQAALRGHSLAALSRMIGRNDAYLQQYVKRGTPRILPERERRILADMLGLDETALGAAPRAEAMRIPRLDVAASAGPGALVDAETVLGTEAISADLARQLRLVAGQCAIVRVRGTSMAPLLEDGDHIVVDQTDRTPARRGGVYVIRVGGAIMVKRVCAGTADWVVTSDNPDAPPLPAGPVDIVGRVVWQMRALR